MQDDDELISSHARHRIRLANGIHQTRCNLFQQLVTHRMSMLVIHGFETVQIQVQQCKVALVTLGLRQRLIKPVSQQQSVGQACQSVVVSQLPLVPLAGGQFLIGRSQFSRAVSHPPFKCQFRALQRLDTGLFGSKHLRLGRFFRTPFGMDPIGQCEREQQQPDE